MLQCGGSDELLPEIALQNVVVEEIYFERCRGNPVDRFAGERLAVQEEAEYSQTQ